MHPTGTEKHWCKQELLFPAKLTNLESNLCFLLLSLPALLYYYNYIYIYNNCTIPKPEGFYWEIKTLNSNTLKNTLVLFFPYLQTLATQWKVTLLIYYQYIKDSEHGISHQYWSLILFLMHNIVLFFIATQENPKVHQPGGQQWQLNNCIWNSHRYKGQKEQD